MKKESKRHKERELALWGIFQEDFNLDGKNEKIDCFIEDYPEEEMNSEIAEEAGGYASQVIETFKENRTEIDKMISKYLKKNWDLSRLPKAEKAILRLAAAEMFFVPEEVPKEIAINEAVELTKKYGEEDGSRYVNGILNNMAKENPQTHVFDLGKDHRKKRSQKKTSGPKKAAAQPAEAQDNNAKANEAVKQTEDQAPEASGESTDET